MSLAPGRLCVSTTGGTSTSARTFCSLRERVLEGNWKRYKIGDSVLVARRFRFDYLYNCSIYSRTKVLRPGPLLLTVSPVVMPADPPSVSVSLCGFAPSARLLLHKCEVR